MPLVTSYQVISDQAVTFGAGTTSDAHFQFQMPADVTPRGDAILAFRVNPKGTATLRVRLNDDVLLMQPFDTEPHRSWHEVFSSSSLKTDGNELIISTDSDEGSFRVSDIVVFVQTPI
jgi:hypothetical protein